MTSASPGNAQTRGFLFADLRGYSRFTEEHGDQAAGELIHRYRELVREQIAAFQGAEIRTEGDSFYVVFDSVSPAVRAGLAIRDAAAEASAAEPDAPIRVGIGIHAGEVEDGADGIVSSAVNIAARVCSVAEPGEVLVTDTVRSLTRSFLPISFTARGKRKLKGIAEPVQVFAVSSSPQARVAGTRPIRAWAGVAAALAVGVAVIVALNVRGGEPPAGGGPGGASPSASAEPSAEETHDLGRFTDPGEFPNAQERALLRFLPSRIADRCERADPDDTPNFHFLPEEADGRRRIPLAATAGLDCLVDGVRVHYWQSAGRGAIPGIGRATDLFFNTARRLSITEGSCAETSRVHEGWEAGLHSGDVLCYSGENGAVLHWTFDDLNVYAIASERGGDAPALYDWWTDVGRLLSE
jgi:class 3 adenylate cyclase